MKIAHLADLHLGFRAFAALVSGRNVREVDVEKAFAIAIMEIIASGADLVTVAGDVFHHPRVSDFAKLAFLRGIRRLLEAGIPVIILQGNHDAGKTADVLTPIMLADALGINLWIVTEPKRIRFRTLGTEVAVACYPYVSRGDGATYTLEPDPTADLNVLVMHASVKGAADGDQLPYFYGSGEAALDIGREADRWDVIAVGDYHEFTRLHPTRLAFYSGSIERTSSNIWQEAAPKGWVLVDTEAGTMEFMEIPTRPMHDMDLDDFAEDGSAVERLNVALTHLSVEGFALGDAAIVRLKVTDFPREERDQIDWALVRHVKSSCCHFELDLRFAAKGVASLGDRRDQPRAAGVQEQAAEFFANDDPPVRELIGQYLEISMAEEPAAEDYEIEEAVVV